MPWLPTSSTHCTGTSQTRTPSRSTWTPFLTWCTMAHIPPAKCTSLMTYVTWYTMPEWGEYVSCQSLMLQHMLAMVGNGERCKALASWQCALTGWVSRCMCVCVCVYLPSCSIQGLSYTHVVLSPYLYLSSHRLHHTWLDTRNLTFCK